MTTERPNGPGALLRVVDVSKSVPGRVRYSRVAVLTRSA
jgi:hypothetical protein